MKTSLTTSNLPPLLRSFRRHMLIFIVICLCMLSIFALSAYRTSFSTTTNGTSVAHASQAPTTTSYPVKVFFSRYPDSLNTNTAVFSVDRSSPTIAVGSFAIQLLIAGPTLSEKQAGYFSELNTSLSGSSNCSSPIPVGGPDFTLTLNKKGSHPESGTATLKFCRSITTGGIGADARITAEIDATLTQFSSIKKVVILTQDGHCFGDESGKDFCLK